MGWPAILAFLLLVLILIQARASRSASTGELPYRWGTLLGALTAGLASLMMFPTVSSLREGSAPEAIACGLCVVCGAFGAEGLLVCKRKGVFFALVFYLQLVMWPAIFMDLRRIPDEQQRSLAKPVCILIATGYFYFSKRWARLT